MLNNEILIITIVTFIQVLRPLWRKKAGEFVPNCSKNKIIHILSTGAPTCGQILLRGTLIYNLYIRTTVIGIHIIPNQNYWISIF